MVYSTHMLETACTRSSVDRATETRGLHLQSEKIGRQRYGLFGSGQQKRLACSASLEEAYPRGVEPPTYRSAISNPPQPASCAVLATLILSILTDQNTPPARVGGTLWILQRRLKNIWQHLGTG